MNFTTFWRYTLEAVRFALICCVFATVGWAADPGYTSANRKFEEIRLGKVKPGAVYSFTAAEINAYARAELPKAVPDGMREPKVELGTDVVTGSALADFNKMQHAAKGSKPNFLIQKLIEGERPVSAMVEVQSSGGRATAFLRRLEVSGVRASGSVLEFLVSTFFRPLYPEAHINESWEVGYNVDRIVVRPDAVRVYIANVLKPVPGQEAQPQPKPKAAPAAPKGGTAKPVTKAPTQKASPATKK